MTPASTAAAVAPLQLGTRRSALAMAQSGHVADAITAATGIPVELVPIVSEGDVSRASLASIGGTGVFATRLREALLAGECDLLVHSLKDLPTADAPGLRLAAVPEREDARDVIVTRGTRLQAFGDGARIGTGSPRRVAQLRSRNPRVRAQDLRGNVDSRLGRVRDGELDGVVLAAAGLSRLGLLGVDPDASGLTFESMGQAEWPTAAGQGALAVEVAADASGDLLAALAPLEHTPTRIAVTIERAILAGIEAGCHAPVGIHAEVLGDEVRVRAIVYGDEGRVGVDQAVMLADGYSTNSGDGDDADVASDADPIANATRIGSAIAGRLLEQGAADLVSRESP